MKKPLLILAGSMTLAWVCLMPRIDAETATFKQQILPMNCLFQTIDVGTGTLRYLTPAECGVVIQQPPSSGASSPTSAYLYNPTQKVFLSQLSKGDLINPTIQLPWRPIASTVQTTGVNQLSDQPPHGLSKTATVGLLAGGLILLLILVLVI